MPPPAVAARSDSVESPFLASGIQWFLPASLVTFFVARSLVLSGKRLMYFDELLTWYPTAAPFHSMLSSTADTINASPPLYFVAIWSWAKLFGASADSLRFFSTLAIGVAIIAMFAVLKRTYGALAAYVALTVAFLAPEIVSQSVNARFYALVLAEVAVGILLYQALLRGRQSLGLLALNTFVHASLVMTHYFGPLYSAAILGGVVLTGVSQRLIPWRIVLSIVAGWLVFLPWIPVFLRHTQMVKPTFAIPVPTFDDLRGYYGHYLTANAALLAAGLGVLALAAGVLVAMRKWEFRGSWVRLGTLHEREKPIFLLAAMFALVPLATYLISIRPNGTSIFHERYLAPGVFGWAVVCAHIAHRVFSLRSLIDRPAAARLLAAAQIGAGVAFMGWCQWGFMDAARRELPQCPPTGFPPPGGKPIIVENAAQFIQIHFYAFDATQYFFAVDRDLAIKIGGGEPANHVIMASLSRQFPERFKEVVSSSEFLATTASFWVMIEHGQWWEARVVQNPAFVSDYLVPRLRLIHVERRK